MVAGRETSSLLAYFYFFYFFNNLHWAASIHGRRLSSLLLKYSYLESFLIAHSPSTPGVGGWHFCRWTH